MLHDFTAYDIIVLQSEQRRIMVEKGIVQCNGVSSAAQHFRYHRTRSGAEIKSVVFGGKFAQHCIGDWGNEFSVRGIVNIVVVLTVSVYFLISGREKLRRKENAGTIRAPVIPSGAAAKKNIADMTAQRAWFRFITVRSGHNTYFPA